MSDAPPEQAWFVKAGADLEMAQRALGPDRPFPDMACFHAQQCAEKYLKGHLVAHDVPFRFVHDLAYLVNLCTSLNPAFEDLRPAARFLNTYIATSRYPAETDPEPDIEAAQEAIRLARHVADFVLSA